MSIQWFPGHMHKARKEIAKVIPDIDVVIEVVDARLPYSSSNPLVRKLSHGKPMIKLLNKSDLSDPELTKEWVEWFRAQENTNALAVRMDQPGQIKRLPQLCKELAPARVKAGRDVRAMIMGIPNVGKSTLINTLAGRKIAKTGNEPAVTKAQQRVLIEGGMALSDTPGMLWPKIEDVDASFRLAATGAVRDTAMHYEEVALYVAGILRDRYPEALMSRYKLKSMPDTEHDIVETIGRKRGCLRAGGIVEMHQASEILIQELRHGQLGLITLDRVDEWEEKLRLEAEAAALAAEIEASNSEEDSSQ
ncbi:ribosome biogenesis GTPase YlqF [Pokkaliibacter sp. CJK22405]|uniref:ribosome biogenesis GTPase YlqF n=1 Tax=Pokkaliibacter sp. CJK22405 TaxID=3384615 RepID=UPI003984CFB4